MTKISHALAARALAFAVLHVHAQQSAPTADAPARAADPGADARIGAFQTEAVAAVEDLHDLTQKMVDSVFSLGELGFQEHETSKYLTNILRQQGFALEEGISGI